MSRLLMISLAAACFLAACGQVITITMPGAAGAGSRGQAIDPTIPDGYERLLSPAPHAFRFSGPGEPVRMGAVSERFELRDGDCGGADCNNTRYRSEIRQLPEAMTARLGQDSWYGWSFYNQNIGAVTRDRSLGTVIGQWKLGGDQPPIFRLLQTPAGEGNWVNCDPTICNRFGAAGDDVVIDLEDMGKTMGWGAAQNSGNVCRLFNMQAAQGKWIDIVVNTNFSTNTDGYLRVWVNGEMKCNYYGRLVASKGAGKTPGHRRGIYNSYTKTWDAKQGGPKPTMIVYYDEFLIGSSRAEVDTRMRQAASARPKD